MAFLPQSYLLVELNGDPLTLINQLCCRIINVN